MAEFCVVWTVCIHSCRVTTIRGIQMRKKSRNYPSSQGNLNSWNGLVLINTFVVCLGNFVSRNIFDSINFCGFTT